MRNKINFESITKAVDARITEQSIIYDIAYIIKDYFYRLIGFERNNYDGRYKLEYPDKFKKCFGDSIQNSMKSAIDKATSEFEPPILNVKQKQQLYTEAFRMYKGSYTDSLHNKIRDLAEEASNIYIRRNKIKILIQLGYTEDEAKDIVKDMKSK